MNKVTLTLAATGVMLSLLHSTTNAADNKDSIKFGQNKFDLYLLTTQWIPGWCEIGTGKSLADLDIIKACQQQFSKPLMYHGLWPANNDGSYPRNCNVISPLKDSKLTFPNPYNNYLKNPNAFINHEWSTHGTCSSYYYKGLESVNEKQYYQKLNQFFSDSITLYDVINIPTLPFTISETQLKDLIHKKNLQIPESAIMVICENSSETKEVHLTGLRFCSSKNINQYITCPSQFNKITCHSNTIFTR